MHFQSLLPLPSKPIRLRRRRVLCPRTRKRRPSQPVRAVLRHIELMMDSNPAVEDVDMVLYSLANVSRLLKGGPPLPPPQSPPGSFVFGQANSASTCVRETRKTMREHRSTSRLVGMTEGYPTLSTTSCVMRSL